MLAVWYDVFNLLSGLWTVFILLAIFSLYNVVFQSHLIYVMGYFSFFIFYIFLLLVQVDFDLAACTVIIIYGSLLVVVFILALSWVDGVHFTYNSSRIWSTTYWWLGILFGIFFISLQSFSFFSLFYFLSSSIRFVNYYEFLVLDMEGELELVGWGLVAFFGCFWLVVFALLGLACILLVCFFIMLRRVGFLGIKSEISGLDRGWFRLQLDYEQELGFNRKLVRFFHRRRF